MANGETNGWFERFWKAILTDVHFWVPLTVLLAGLVVLRWIQ
ncbi:MAG TPA: hypothetical protein VJN42_03865 [Candidatus Acidoferrum sp.]|nr:hypothetical protein [Candidatus Acidoferrum sp.]